MRRYLVELAERTVTVEVDGEVVRVEGQVVDLGIGGAPGEAWRRVRSHGAGGSTREFVVGALGQGRWRLAFDGHRFDALVLDARGAAVRATHAAAPAAGGTLRAPMPGLVVRVLVREGEPVEAGSGLLVVEAMKMENELKATGAGRVARVHVKTGDRIEKGAALVEIGPMADG